MTCKCNFAVDDFDLPHVIYIFFIKNEEISFAVNKKVPAIHYVSTKYKK